MGGGGAGNADSPLLLRRIKATDFRNIIDKEVLSLCVVFFNSREVTNHCKFFCGSYKFFQGLSIS